MPIFLLLPNLISNLKRKHAGGGTNIMVNNWFIEPDPNPIQPQVRVP
jgi:hypothetical protein